MSEGHLINMVPWGNILVLAFKLIYNYFINLPFMTDKIAFEGAQFHT